MTLAPIDTGTDLTRWVQLLAPARQLAEVLAETDFVPKAMRGKPDVVTAAIMYGDEIGLGPMQALAGLDVVEGKPRPSAELARALILRAGHTFTVHDASGSRVRVSGLRAGRPESERVLVEWTTDMARAAGLLNKQNWRNYPRAMLMARATSDLARILFADVIKGLGYIAETEADAQTLESWAPPAETPEVPPVAPPDVPMIQRRTRPRPASMEDRPLPTPGAGEEQSDASPAPGPPTTGGGARTTPPVPGEGASPSVPDMPPERPAEPDPAGEAEPIREAQRKAIFAQMGRTLGASAQRAERLALCSAILRRPVQSSSDLTRDEAYQILAWLHEFAAGDVGWEYDHDRQIGKAFRVGEDPESWTPAPPDPWAKPETLPEAGDTS